MPTYSRAKFVDLDGQTDTFSFGFDYLSKNHLKVEVDGEAVAYSFTSNNSIKLHSTPEQGSTLIIRRVTPRDKPWVNFQDGSVFLQSDLDAQGLQVLFIAQESYDEGKAAIEYANKARLAADEAEIESNDAELYSNLAGKHKTTADRFANEAEDTTVVDASNGNDTGKYSANHHKAKAQSAKSAAKTAALLSAVFAADLAD